jgi:hypothetical protein
MRIKYGECHGRLTSIEVNGFPLYASANSAASAAFGNLMTTIDRLGAESLRVWLLTTFPKDTTNTYLIILR